MERVFNFLALIFRVPKNISNEEKMKDIGSFGILLLGMFASGSVCAMLHVFPFISEDPEWAFGQENNYPNIDVDLWILWVCQDLSFIVCVATVVVAFLFQIRKTWILLFETLALCFLFCPSLFLLRNVVQVEMVIYLITATTFVFLLSTDKSRKLIFVCFLCAILYVPHVAVIVYRTVQFALGKEVQHRSNAEEMVMVAMSFIGNTVNYAAVVTTMTIIKISYDKYRRKVFDIAAYLNDVENRSDISDLVRVKSARSFLFRDLDNIFDSVIEMAQQIKSFLPKTAQVGGISSRNNSFNSDDSSSSGNSEESGESLGSSGSGSRRTNSFEVGVARVNATIVCITFGDFLDTEEGGSSDSRVSIHSKLLKMIEKRATSYRGLVGEYNERSFVVLFDVNSPVSNPAKAVKFANCIVGEIKTLNEEFLSDTLSFIRAGIAIHTGSVSQGILGHRSRRFSVYFGKSKRIVRGMCEYCLSISPHTSIFASGAVSIENNPGNIIEKEPIDLLYFPNNNPEEQGTLTLVQVYRMNVKTMVDKQSEHSYLLKTETDGMGKDLDDAFLALRENRIDEMMKLLDKRKEFANCSLKVLGKMMREKGVSVNDIVEKVKVDGMSRLYYVSIFGKLKAISV